MTTNDDEQKCDDLQSGQRLFSASLRFQNLIKRHRLRRFAFFYRLCIVSFAKMFLDSYVDQVHALRLERVKPIVDAVFHVFLQVARRASRVVGIHPSNHPSIHRGIHPSIHRTTTTTTTTTTTKKKKKKKKNGGGRVDQTSQTNGGFPRFNALDR